MEAEQIKADIIRSMTERGWRITSQRRSLAGLFAETDRYWSPLDIHENMKKQYPGVSFDTVYRNLRLLSEGEDAVLEQFHFNEGVRFRARCLGHHHHHIICLDCERTYTFDFCPLEEVKGMPPQFDVISHRFEIFGYCSKCQAARSDGVSRDRKPN